MPPVQAEDAGPPHVLHALREQSGAPLQQTTSTCPCSPRCQSSDCLLDLTQRYIVHAALLPVSRCCCRCAGPVLWGLPVHALWGERAGGGPEPCLGVPQVPRHLQLLLLPHQEGLGAHRSSVPARPPRRCAPTSTELSIQCSNPESLWAARAAVQLACHMWSRSAPSARPAACWILHCRPCLQPTASL